jgi:hypothetical protein
MTLEDLPPKESGNWIDDVFDWCVRLLLDGAAALHISYNAINVLIFCIIWPLFTLALCALVVVQYRKIRKVEKQLPQQPPEQK